MQNKQSKLKFTGERMANHPDSLMYQVSMARYKFAQQFCKNKTILDIACGSGYGSNFLADYAKEVTGVDIDENTIEYCKKNYEKSNLTFSIISPEEKVESLVNQFDLIISFETIEHTYNPKKFLENLKSYLKDNGTIVLSTPNNVDRIHPPKNKFHVYEFEINELHQILKEIFPNRKISSYGQGIVTPKTTKTALISKLFGIIYDFDKEYFGILQKIDHLPIYKKIGKLQSNTSNNEIEIREINLAEPYTPPAISMFVINLSS